MHVMLSSSTPNKGSFYALHLALSYLGLRALKLDFLEGHIFTKRGVNIFQFVVKLNS